LISLRSLDHPAKCAVLRRVFDDRFRLSRLAPGVLQHRHRKVRVCCHHPFDALRGSLTDTTAKNIFTRSAAVSFVGFSVGLPCRYHGAAEADGFPWFGLSHNRAMWRRFETA